MNNINLEAEMKACQEVMKRNPPTSKQWQEAHDKWEKLLKTRNNWTDAQLFKAGCKE